MRRVFRFTKRNKGSRVPKRKRIDLTEWEKNIRAIRRYAGVYGLSVSYEKQDTVIVWIEKGVELIDYPLLHLAMCREEFRKYIVIRKVTNK
jgi:hypothetical protein